MMMVMGTRDMLFLLAGALSKDLMVMLVVMFVIVMMVVVKMW